MGKTDILVSNFLINQLKSEASCQNAEIWNDRNEEMRHTSEAAAIGRITEAFHKLFDVDAQRSRQEKMKEAQGFESNAAMI